MPQRRSPDHRPVGWSAARDALHILGAHTLPFTDPSPPRPLVPTAAPRPTVCLVTPATHADNTGNWHTAARWARFLRPAHRVRIVQAWDGAPCDLLIALHARRSAESIAAFRAAHPDGAIVVVLTGTDLYRDVQQRDVATLASLDAADRLVVLQDLAVQAVPAEHRAKACVIFQSARALTRGRRRRTTFDIAVVGHLRDEKDPLLPMHAALTLPAEIRARVLHAGAPLDARYATAARRTERQTPHYRWLGELSRARARQLMRRAALLLHPSRMEGGAQAVLEAIRSGTPVIVSDADGNLGLVGRNYPGVFPVGAVHAATELIARAAREPAFLRRLASACRARAWLFDPRVEQAAVRDLVRSLLHNRALAPRRRAR
jgi:putative glycosyltransferase (TIGR04348 family)